MREVPGTALLAEVEPSAPDLLLLIAPEPWLRSFLQNLRDLFNRPATGHLPHESAPADFWPDVFVDRTLPWRQFLQSAAYHALALAVIWAGSRFLAAQPRAITQSAFAHADSIHYAPSEYLPPLDTRHTHTARARKADPEHAPQSVISVPREPANRSQTVVTAPSIQLQHEVALPNVVAWSGKAQLPIGPAPVVAASQITRLAPQMQHSVIAPPQDVQTASRKLVQAPVPAVVAPPPAVEAGTARRIADLNIAPSTVIVPAPQLAIDARRTLSSRSSALSRTSAVIAPPPALSASSRSGSGGTSRHNMIALNLHPTVGAPPDPAGNRRGDFAATPGGHRGASGAPGESASSGKGEASGSARKTNGALPSGLYVGKTTNVTSPVAGDPTPKSSNAYAINPRLLANARPPLAGHSLQPAGDTKVSDEERAVFGTRKFYSLSLNMPNLNSAGGSWIIRFAALKPDAIPSEMPAHAAGAASASGSSSELSSELLAPATTRKVDPAYPLELMKQNVAGTVILYGIIHADGTVGSVRVLRSVDDRLDHFAAAAIAKWQFQPATRNGTPVDVEATFWIPFKPTRVGSNF